MIHTIRCWLNLHEFRRRWSVRTLPDGSQLSSLDSVCRWCAQRGIATGRERFEAVEREG